MKDIPFMRSLFFQFEFETSANEPRQTNHEKGCRMKRQSFFTCARHGRTLMGESP